MTHAVTITAAGIADALRSPCTVSPVWDPRSSDPQPPQFPCQAIWDTGAMMSVIDWRVVEQCHPPHVGVAEVKTVHGTEEMPIHVIDLALSNDVRVPALEVIAGDIGDAEVLIGMDVITRGDLAVTNADGFTQFSFRTPSQGHIDFTAESDPGGRPAGPPTP